METLLIEKTKSTPMIDFDVDRKILCISGESYPENSFKFYEPVLNWIEDFFTETDKDSTITLELSLPYINTSSSKCIMMLLDRFEEAYNNGFKVTVNWICQKDNENEIECAEEFKEFVNIDFNIIIC